MVEPEWIALTAAGESTIPCAFKTGTVEVAPSVDPARCRQSREVFSANECLARFVLMMPASVEIADEHKRFLMAMERGT